MYTSLNVFKNLAMCIMYAIVNFNTTDSFMLKYSYVILNTIFTPEDSIIFIYKKGI
jgi:hypothetical protein